MPDENEVDTPEDKNGPDLRKTGTIHLWADGKKVRLRNPRMREFRALLDAWTETADVIANRQRANLQWIIELNQKRVAEGRDVDKGDGETERVARDLTPEEKEEDRRRGREGAEYEEKLIPEWWKLAIDTLVVTEAGSTTVAGDMISNPPMWMQDVATVNEVFNHWRTVPSPSGVR